MKTNTKKIVGLGILTAIVIVLQVLAVALRPTGVFTISLVLIPIVVGAALYGYGAGAWLGLVFSIVVLINDAAAFLAISVPGTIATVVCKGVLAGFCAGLIYKALENVNRYFAVIAAAVVCPVVNTGIFLLGCRLFFWSTLTEWASAAGISSVPTYLVTVLVGVNFLIEMAINIVLSPVIVRVISIGRKENKE